MEAFADEIWLRPDAGLAGPDRTRRSRSEIKLNGLDELFWLRAASSADDCLAGHCDNYKSKRCFYWNSRRAAHDADVIVTNHALLLADALAGGSVLPAHEHVIVDEAHQLEEAAVDALTLRVGEEEMHESIDGTLTWFRAACGPPSERLRAEGAALAQATTRFFLEARRWPEAATRGAASPRARRAGGPRCRRSRPPRYASACGALERVDPASRQPRS